jgi:hypothetical protein
MLYSTGNNNVNDKCMMVGGDVVKGWQFFMLFMVLIFTPLKVGEDAVQTTTFKRKRKQTAYRVYLEA